MVSYIWRTGFVGQGVSSALLYFIIVFCNTFIKSFDSILDHSLITCADLTLTCNAKQSLASDVTLKPWYGFGGGVPFIPKKAAPKPKKARLSGYTSSRIFRRQSQLTWMEIICFNLAAPLDFGAHRKLTGGFVDAMDIRHSWSFERLKRISGSYFLGERWGSRILLFDVGSRKGTKRQYVLLRRGCYS